MWPIDAFSDYVEFTDGSDKLLLANLSRLSSAIKDLLRNIQQNQSGGNYPQAVPIVFDSLIPLLSENSANTVIYFLQSLRQLRSGTCT